MRGSTRAAALAGLVTLAAWPAPVRADGEASCALAACIAQGLARHPVLAGMQGRVEEARATAGLRRAETLPTFSVEGGPGYINGEAITLFGALGGRRRADGTLADPLQGALYDATFVMLLPVLREGRLLGQSPIAEREARLWLEEEEMSRSALSREVAGAVADAWFTALKLQKAEPLQARVVTAQEAILKGAQAREEQRLISHATALAANVELAAARHDLETTRIARSRAERALGAATGLVGTPVAPVEDGSTSLPDSAVVTSTTDDTPKALETAGASPAVRAAELRVQQKAEEIARIRKQWWPSATLRAHYGVADAFALPVNNQYYFGLRFSIPLFDSGQTSKRVAVARAQKEQEEAALANVRLIRAAEMDDLTARLRQLGADIELRTAQIEQAREAVRAIRARAAERLAAPGEEDEAEVALLRLELARNAAVHDRALAETRLRIANGEWDSSGPVPAP